MWRKARDETGGMNGRCMQEKEREGTRERGVGRGQAGETGACIPGRGNGTGKNVRGEEGWDEQKAYFMLRTASYMY